MGRMIYILLKYFFGWILQRGYNGFLKAVGMLSHCGLAAMFTLSQLSCSGQWDARNQWDVRMSSDEQFSFRQAAGAMRSTDPPRGRDRTASAELIGPDQVLLCHLQTLEGTWQGVDAQSCSYTSTACYYSSKVMGTMYTAE